VKRSPSIRGRQDRIEAQVMAKKRKQAKRIGKRKSVSKKQPPKRGRKVVAKRHRRDTRKTSPKKAVSRIKKAVSRIVVFRDFGG
jgi:hypothetical protein